MIEQPFVSQPIAVPPRPSANMPFNAWGKISPQMNVEQLCDESCVLVESGFVQAGMSVLFRGLLSLRSRLSRERWLEAIGAARRHRVSGLLMQDPITKRCFDKPRGYAGDAGLLDLIYGWPPGARAVWEATPTGKAIFECTSNSVTAQSVRDRRTTLSDLVDRCATEVPRARILSVAAGHLREGVTSAAIREGRVGEMVALDQDSASLAEVEREFAGGAVRAVRSTIRPLLTGRHKLGKFDLIYSAGLYDYLDTGTAVRLTARLFGMLRPGGRLWVANFLPEIGAVGYMEAFMDWHLLYRTQEEILGLTREVPESDVWSRSVSVDRHKHVGSLELIRCGTANTREQPSPSR